MGAVCCGMAPGGGGGSAAGPTPANAAPGMISRPIRVFRPHWNADSPTTRAQLLKMRDEFWETAPKYDGRREIWDALRAACSADNVEMAQAIVDSANVILPTGQLTEAYDELGNKYTIPLFCICEPANLQDGGARQPAEVADTPSSAGGRKITLRVRLSTMKDLSIELTSNETVLRLKQRICELENIQPELQRVLVVGQLLADRTRLGEVPALQNNAVVQVLVKAPE